MHEIRVVGEVSLVILDNCNSLNVRQLIPLPSPNEIKDSDRELSSCDEQDATDSFDVSSELPADILDIQFLYLRERVNIVMFS